MPTIDLLKALAIILGVSVASVLIGMLLMLLYPPLRLFVADVTKLLGFAGKWVRKVSVASELEGSVNSFSKYYNSELTTAFLPECNIEWVTEKNQEAVIKPGKVIVKLSFANDRDLNLLNAASLFVRVGLLPRVKPFLSSIVANAIDLMVVRGLLRRSDRSALNAFNNRFVEEDEGCRQAFYKLEEIDERGLFKRILLQEYFFFGETIGDRAPRAEHSREADEFLEWLHALATREGLERSILHFKGPNIQVGVLLIAKEDTYRQYGIDPYLRRASTYAVQGFSTIYLLSRGSRRARVAKQIADELVAQGSFQALTKKTDIRIESDDGDLITCIPFKIDLTGLVYSAWERLRAAYEGSDEIAVEVGTVLADRAIVSAYGLATDMALDELSELAIVDARRYFSPGQELNVIITQFDYDSQNIRLSNVGTKTDPKNLVDAFSDRLDEPVDATVVGYSLFDGYETGIFLRIEESSIRGFVPRSKATFSRFVQLSLKYPVDTRIRVLPTTFNVEYGNITCAIEGLNDPWEQVSKYAPGSTCNTVIRQITERYLTCELEEGLDGTVFVEEISWDSLEENLRRIKSYQVSESVPAKLLSYDAERRFIRLSIKRVKQSATEKWFLEHSHRFEEAVVQEVMSRGARVIFPDTEVEGFLPLAEISWFYCDSIESLLSAGQIVTVRLLSYDPVRDNIKVSIKAINRNDYEDFKQTYEIGSRVAGRVQGSTDNQVELSISFGEGMEAQAYVYKSELSNLLFVSKENIGTILEKGSSYPFVVKRFHDSARTIEVSRKLLFKMEHEYLKYGRDYEGRVLVAPKTRFNLFYSDVFEARIQKTRHTTPGREAQVIIARLGETERDVEVEATRQ